jgi:PilZ domain
MAEDKVPRIAGRARRFSLRFPVYYRQLDSPTWLQGTTENISHTGVLFLSSSPLAPETTLDMRLKVAVRTKGGGPAEVRCKGLVVRLEPRNEPRTPIALAVAIRDYRIVRQQSGGGDSGHAA